MDIIQILGSKYKNNGWSLIRTKKRKPFGYIGYMLTIYGKDDITPILDIKGRNLNSIMSQLLEVKK